MNHETALQKEIFTNHIGSRIYTIRGTQVMLDCDLAKIYDVQTKHFNEKVKRNLSRFPANFMFQLENDEVKFLRSQIATSKSGFDFERRGGNRYLPFAFTELGVAMLSSILNSEKAIMINIQIMETFVRLRKQEQIYYFEVHSKMNIFQKELNLLSEKVQHLENACITENNPVEVIQNTVAKHWGLQIADLKSSARKKSIALARQVAMYLIRQKLFLSFSEIGSHFGRRDHTTVLHSLCKIESMLNENIIFRNTVSSLAA